MQLLGLGQGPGAALFVLARPARSGWRGVVWTRLDMSVTLSCGRLSLSGASSQVNRALIRCISFEAADALMAKYRRLCEKKEFPFMFKDARGQLVRCYLTTQKP